jgi:hypothetical protein
MVNISQALWIKSVKFRPVILLASQKSLNCEPFFLFLSSGHSGDNVRPKMGEVSQSNDDRNREITKMRVVHCAGRKK